MTWSTTTNPTKPGANSVWVEDGPCRLTMGLFSTLIVSGTNAERRSFYLLSVAYLSRLREVLYRKQLALFFHHTYSNRIHVPVENI
jgi:hypothetical protein